MIVRADQRALPNKKTPTTAGDGVDALLIIRLQIHIIIFGVNHLEDFRAEIKVDESALGAYLKDVIADAKELDGVYDGMSDRDIMDTFGEKVWQLNDADLATTQVSVDDDGSVHANVAGNSLHAIGTIYEADEIKYHQLTSALHTSGAIKITGGNYKQSVTAEDGSIAVKQFRTPVHLYLTVKASKIVETPRPAPTVAPVQPVIPQQNGWEKAANGAQKFADATDKAGKGLSNFGCAMTLGCTVPIIIILLLLGLL